MRRKPYVSTYKPEPPPKPRYKARQAPLRVFVTSCSPTPESAPHREAN